MQSETITPGLLRIAEACAYLAISERSLWNLLKDGRIPAVRFGKIIRIDRRDLDSFIQAAKGAR